MAKKTTTKPAATSTEALDARKELLDKEQARPEYGTPAYDGGPNGKPEGIGIISHAQNPSIIARARDFYAVYCASSDGKNFQGNPCPAWDSLPEAVRGHWYTVALRSWSLEARTCSERATHEHYLGHESRNPPNLYVLGHLPDREHALEVWQQYSGIAKPADDTTDDNDE